MMRDIISLLALSVLLVYFTHPAAGESTTAAPAVATTAAPAAATPAAAAAAAVAAPAPAGAPDAICPNITLKALRIACETVDGGGTAKPVACNLVTVGGSAKVTWRKHALKNTNSALEIECVSPGVWKIKSKKAGDYKVHKEKKSWSEAEGVCVKGGGHLVTIETEGEMNVIKSLAATIGNVSGSINAMHIGLFDRNVEGMFETVLGAPFKATAYFPWRKGKPRGSLGEDCVVLYLDTFDASDMSCRERLPFICETYQIPIFI